LALAVLSPEVNCDYQPVALSGRN
jgi:mannose-6-phosphate isomerase-like protein (cupin superfamily)